MDAHRLMKILKQVDPKTEIIITINKGAENEVTDVGRWFEKEKRIMKLAINIEKKYHIDYEGCPMECTEEEFWVNELRIKKQTKEETSDDIDNTKNSTEDKSMGVPDIYLRCTEDREINTGC